MDYRPICTHCSKGKADVIQDRMYYCAPCWLVVFKRWYTNATN